MSKHIGKPKVQRDQPLDEVAEELGLFPGTLRGYCRRKQNPCPCRRKGRLIFLNIAEVRAWMLANHVTGKVGRPTEKETSPEIDKARLRKERALARKYELQVAQTERELLSAAEVEQAWARIGTNIRQGFQSLPSQLIPLALSNGMPNEAAAAFRDQIEQAITGILRQLSSGNSSDSASEVPASPAPSGAVEPESVGRELPHPE